MTDDVKAAAREAQDSPVLEVLARIGYIVLGIVHIVIGVAGLLDAPASTQADLLSTADRNLYAAKHGLGAERPRDGATAAGGRRGRPRRPGQHLGDKRGARMTEPARSSGQPAHPAG